jgi:GNAT superfamily N-acetyltransferase
VRTNEFSLQAVDANDAARAFTLVGCERSRNSRHKTGRVKRAESGVESLARKIVAASCAIGAFAREQIVGFLLMPTPTLLGMLFVHPARLRQGIGTKLWEFATCAAGYFGRETDQPPAVLASEPAAKQAANQVFPLARLSIRSQSKAASVSTSFCENRWLGVRRPAAQPTDAVRWHPSSYGLIGRRAIALLQASLNEAQFITIHRMGLIRLSPDR